MDFVDCRRSTMQEMQQRLLAFRIYRTRDPEAYSALYQEHARSILRYLSVKLPRKEDADELLSEVFLRGWEYMTANFVEHPHALFRKIAHNLIVDFYRKGEKTEVLDDALAETLAEPSSLAETVADKQEAEALVLKLQQLKPEYRQVLTLKYFSQMSVLEIAEALDRSPNAIRILAFRALRALKKL